MNILGLFWNFKKSDKEITDSEYYNRLIKGETRKEIKYTYEKAWESKQFEIENYWKRANYFWLFQVAAFTAYFGFLNSKIYDKGTEVLYAVIAIGFLTGLAWVLTNIGSKQWQENWEMHVNKLEDFVTGPLYKIGTNQWTYSVSKINLIVSIFITLIWVILAIKYLVAENIKISPLQNSEPQWFIIGITFMTILFAVVMACGYGRSIMKFRNKKFYRYYENQKCIRGEENKEKCMKKEKVLHEKNETLRIIGMYSFLFFAAACAVLVILKEKIPSCFTILFCVIAGICIIGFFVFVCRFICCGTNKGKGSNSKGNVEKTTDTGNEK
jgi:hypothetical protein